MVHDLLAVFLHDIFMLPKLCFNIFVYHPYGISMFFFLVVTRTIPVLQIGLPISDEWFPHAGCERVQAQQNIKEEKVITMILESCCIRELKAGSCRYLLRFLYLLIPQNLLRYCKPSCDPYILKGAPHSEQEHLGDPQGQNRIQSVWSSGLLLPLDLLAKVPCILHFIAVAKCYIYTLKRNDAEMFNLIISLHVVPKPRLLGNIGFKHCLTSWVRCMLDCRLLECLQAV
jgi:hypothetical protein